MKSADIVAFSGDSLLSTAIKIGTFGFRGSISHVGIVARNGDGRLRLYESTLEDGVREAGIKQSIERYCGRVYLYPLSRELFEHEEDRLSRWLQEQVGKPYDLGAVKAAGFFAAKSKAASTRKDLKSLFCSELCCEALNQCGIFPASNPARHSPNSLCRTLLYRGLVLHPERIR